MLKVFSIHAFLLRFDIIWVIVVLVLRYRVTNELFILHLRVWIAEIVQKNLREVKLLIRFRIRVIILR